MFDMKIGNDSMSSRNFAKFTNFNRFYNFVLAILTFLWPRFIWFLIAGKNYWSNSFKAVN